MSQSQDVRVRHVRPAEACKIVGIGQSTLWDWIKKQKPGFPQPYRLSARCTVFDAAALDAYVKSMGQPVQGASSGN